MAISVAGCQLKRLAIASITSPYLGGSMTGGLAMVEVTPGIVPSCNRP